MSEVTKEKKTFQGRKRKQLNDNVEPNQIVEVPKEEPKPKKKKVLLENKDILMQMVDSITSKDEKTREEKLKKEVEYLILLESKLFIHYSQKSKLEFFKKKEVEKKNKKLLQQQRRQQVVAKIKKQKQELEQVKNLHINVCFNSDYFTFSLKAPKVSTSRKKEKQILPQRKLFDLLQQRRRKRID